jgi:hypothetical protein
MHRDAPPVGLPAYIGSATDKSFLLLFFKKAALAFLPKHNKRKQALLF